MNHQQEFSPQITTPVLEGKGLTVSYGNRQVLDVDYIQVPPERSWL